MALRKGELHNCLAMIGILVGKQKEVIANMQLLESRIVGVGCFGARATRRAAGCDWPRTGRSVTPDVPHPVYQRV